MKRYMPPITLVVAGLILFFAAPAIGEDAEPTRVDAVAPTFIDPTCSSAGDFVLPEVEGLDYQYNFDYEAPEDSPRFYVTVEPAEGYEISSFGGDFDAGFEHGFGSPIAAGAWVHEYSVPSRCGDRAPIDSNPGGLPSVGA